jgi:hypothetical protein
MSTHIHSSNDYVLITLQQHSLHLLASLPWCINLIHNCVPPTFVTYWLITERVLLSLKRIYFSLECQAQINSIGMSRSDEFSLFHSLVMNRVPGQIQNPHWKCSNWKKHPSRDLSHFTLPCGCSKQMDRLILWLYLYTLFSYWSDQKGGEYKKRHLVEKSSIENTY